MEITFKNVGNKTFKYTVSKEDTFKSMVETLIKDNQSTPDSQVKFIYKGKVLEHESTFSVLEEEKPTVIIIISKPKPNVGYTPNPTSVPVSNPTQVNDSNQVPDNIAIPNPFTNTVENTEPSDDIVRIQETVIGVLAMIKQNPQLTEMFNNNFEMLAGILMSPLFRPLFEAVNDITNEEHSELNVNQEPTDNTNMTLSEGDMNNVATLQALGFSQSDCIQAYLLCNKNLELAASMLMDSLN